MIELFIKFKFLEGLLKEYFGLFILFTVLINNSNAFSQKDSTQQISSQLENTLNWNAKDSIVLDMKNKNASTAQIPQVFLSNLEESNTLSTEVGILESPSVLRPIYEFVISV